MKYSDYVLYIFLCLFLALSQSRAVEYIYHKKIIEKKSPEKEKIFNYIRENIEQQENERQYILNIEKDKKLPFLNYLSPSLQQKINTERIFHIKENKVLPAINEKTDKGAYYFSAINLKFVTSKEEEIKNIFEERFGLSKDSLLLRSFFSFLLVYLLEKGIKFDQSAAYAGEILENSNIMKFLTENMKFDLTDYILFIKDKFIMSREKTQLFNKKAKSILEKVIIWNMHDKIEHERALNQFYNMAKRQNCCALFSFYKTTGSFAMSSLESYGDLHIANDIYKNVLFDSNYKPSPLRKRSLEDVGVAVKKWSFFMMPFIKNNMVYYFAPLSGMLSIEQIFQKISQEDQSLKLCSIVFLDKDDIKFLLS